MTHYLNLNPKPYKLIKEKKKDIEMRLFDEKRKDIKIGDVLVFTNNKTNEQLKVVVTSLYKFPSFKEVYQNFDKKRLGYKEEETSNYHDMNKYYSDEQIDKYGVLAIEILLIK